MAVRQDAVHEASHACAATTRAFTPVSRVGWITGAKRGLWLVGSELSVPSCFALSDNFWLHKFRATFATWSLWAGVDLRTVQQWLAHSDMESTMRYLKPSRSQQVREKVNEIFA